MMNVPPMTAQAQIRPGAGFGAGLTSLTLCCNHPPHAGGKAGSRVLTFLVDRGSNGQSTAQTEWRAHVARYPNPMSVVYRHLLLVDAVKAVGSPQQQGATQYRGTTPDLFWYDVGGIGVFYTWDAVDPKVVLVGAIANPPPPSFNDFYQTASGRL